MFTYTLQNAMLLSLNIPTIVYSWKHLIYSLKGKEY